jgi:DHA2 family multidrug resistance protein
MSPFNPVLQQVSPGAVAGNVTALAQLDGLVNLQSAMIAYIDDFKLMMFVTLAALPLSFLLRRQTVLQTQGAAVMVHAD